MKVIFDGRNSHEADGVYRGPIADMPRPYLEEEVGQLRFVIPNLNTETHLELAGNAVTKTIDAFTCREYSDPLQESYPITISPEKTQIILRGLVHIADEKRHDPVVSVDWARKTLDRVFGVSEDLTENWFFKLCEREIELGKMYN